MIQSSQPTKEMDMRFTTSTGKTVTAASKAAAAAMAAQYGMGEIVSAASEPAKRATTMTVAKAVCLFAQAQEWPQCGQGWPIDAQQRAAQSVIAANPGCTDDVW